MLLLVFDSAGAARLRSREVKDIRGVEAGGKGSLSTPRAA